jgi:hypothetical protein
MLISPHFFDLTYSSGLKHLEEIRAAGFFMPAVNQIEVGEPLISDFSIRLKHCHHAMISVERFNHFASNELSSPIADSILSSSKHIAPWCEVS